jgi:enamine deaminase RidA (YjgF/YER057c/UK114 family)
MQRRDINAPDAPAPVGAYTHAVEISAAARTVYISGQVGVNADGSIPDDLATQCANVWKNIEAQLRAVGMTYDNIVKMVTILTDHAHLAESRQARSAAMGERKPASTLIIAGLVSPKLKIEIEVIACA